MTLDEQRVTFPDVVYAIRDIFQRIVKIETYLEKGGFVP